MRLLMQLLFRHIGQHRGSHPAAFVLEAQIPSLLLIILNCFLYVLPCCKCKTPSVPPAIFLHCSRQCKPPFVPCCISPLTPQGPSVDTACTNAKLTDQLCQIRASTIAGIMSLIRCSAYFPSPTRLRALFMLGIYKFWLFNWISSKKTLMLPNPPLLFLALIPYLLTWKIQR